MGEGGERGKKERKGEEGEGANSAHSETYRHRLIPRCAAWSVGENPRGGDARPGEGSRSSPDVTPKKSVLARPAPATSWIEPS